MYANNNYFYDDNGDHCLIRNDDVRKTIISQISGFYIYKEEIIPYIDNSKLCEKVLNILLDNKSINEFKTKSLATMLGYVDYMLEQKVINYVLERKDSKELALMGIDMLVKGIEKKWENEALKTFMNYADISKYSLIYKANPKLIKDIQILSLINPDFLTDAHKKQVEEYKKDRQAKLDTIKKIIGEITASGIREKKKELKASEITKKFTKLANNYIGHSKLEYETMDLKELDKHLKKLNEMYDIMKELKKQID